MAAISKSTSRTIEIVILSAENLRIGGKTIKTNAFVTVKSDSQNFRTTEINEDRGSFPSWNEKLVLDLPMNATFMTVEVCCRSSGRKVRSVGKVKIPVSDFSGGIVPECLWRSLSYRLKDDKGERNGIVNLSVRVKVPENRCCLLLERELGAAVPEKGIGRGEVVVGIPVWSYYNNPANCGRLELES